jgi:P-type Cu+ transporter
MNREVSLRIEGIRSHTCIKKVEEALKHVKGVKDASVQFPNAQVFVSFDAGQTDKETLILTIEKAGYKAFLIDPSSKELRENQQKEIKRYFKSFVIAFLLSLPFFIQMLGVMIGYSFAIPPLLQLLLATPVQFGCGAIFYRNFLSALRSKQENRDLLIAMGTTAAYGLSLYIYFFELNQSLYFENSAIIITLSLLGRWLELLTRERNFLAIERLIQWQPKIAFVEREGQWVELPVAKMKEGDLFLVRPGERIPADGVILEGNSSVDESSLTSASELVAKQQGSIVLAGTLNQEGLIKVQTTQFEENTAASAMIRLINKDWEIKTPLQRLINRVSTFFALAVLALSFLTYFGWLWYGASSSSSLINAVSVLVMACPAALGLVFPSVILMARELGFQYGILFKEASSIERAGEITLLYLDKIEVLTEGKPKIEGIYPVFPFPGQDFLEIALSLETQASDPIAKGLIAYCKEEGILERSVSQVKVFPGKGIAGRIDQQDYYFGSLSFAKECEVSIDDAMPLLERKGNTICALWTKDKVKGYIAITDHVQEASREAIESFKEMNIHAILLTDDQTEAARSIASEAGIEEIKEKAFLLTAEKKGDLIGRVAVSLHDLSALRTADVSFAIGIQSAFEAADVTLKQRSLLEVARAVRLAKAAIRKIKQNLFLVFIYNGLAICIAALGLLTSFIAAGTMAMSLVFVIANTLLLRYKKI